MTIIRISARAQITLPAELGKALEVGTGDYLEEVVEGGLMLKPVALLDRKTAKARLNEFCAEVAMSAQPPSPLKMR